MKKIISAVLLLVLTLSFVLTGCSPKEKTLAELKETGEIVMGTNVAFPPYEFYPNEDSSNATGIDVEIMEAIAKDLGVTLRIEDMEFDSIVMAVSSGKVDVGAAGMSVDEKRLKNVNFTDTYTNAKQVIIVKEDSPISAIGDLEGKKVGVQSGTTGDTYASDDKTIGSVERYSNGILAVQSLKQDKIDAVIIDNEPAKVFVKQNEGLKILDEEYTDENYAIAVAKQNKEILEALNQSLAKLKADGTIQAIIDKYINAEE